MPATRIDLGYEARRYFEPFHARRERWAVLVCHRRAGKTVACIADLIDAALRCTKPRPRFHYIAPLLKQAKATSWDYLKAYGLRVPGAQANETELRLDLPNGGQVRLYGADNPDALRGIYSDGVVLDEAADMHPRLFNEILRPALSDRQGWGVWIGTPRGQNSFYDLIHGDKATGWIGAKNSPDWLYTLLRVNDTFVLPQTELDDARRSMTQEQFEQEYYCSFSAAIIGAYYGREMQTAEDEGRITTSVYDKAIEVHTAWDIGIGASGHTAIWFYQQAGFETRLIDYYASWGHGFDHYAKVLQDRGYRYGQHYLPHDIEVKELGTGRSRLETVQSLGISGTVVRKLSIEDGINAVHRILPRCWFDRDKCEEGLKALRQYRRDFDDVRKVYLERPLKDWTNHPADAFRYLAVSLQEPRALAANTNAYPKRAMGWVV